LAGDEREALRHTTETAGRIDSAVGTREKVGFEISAFPEVCHISDSENVTKMSSITHWHEFQKGWIIAV
jgi:hypothetical protein